MSKKRTIMTAKKLETVMQMYQSGIKKTVIADWLGSSDTNVDAYVHCAKCAEKGEPIGQYHVNMAVIADWCEKHGYPVPKRAAEQKPTEENMPIAQAETVETIDIEQLWERLDKIIVLLETLTKVWGE